MYAALYRNIKQTECYLNSIEKPPCSSKNVQYTIHRVQFTKTKDNDYSDLLSPRYALNVSCILNLSWTLLMSI